MSGNRRLLRCRSGTSVSVAAVTGGLMVPVVAEEVGAMPAAVADRPAAVRRRSQTPGLLPPCAWRVSRFAAFAAFAATTRL